MEHIMQSGTLWQFQLVRDFPDPLENTEGAIEFGPKLVAPFDVHGGH
jgi:hypothetical protein